MKDVFAHYFYQASSESISEELQRLEKENLDYRKLQNQQRLLAEKIEKKVGNFKLFDEWETLQISILTREQDAIYRQAFANFLHLLCWAGLPKKQKKKN